MSAISSSSSANTMSITTINRGILHATINMRGFAANCGCGERWTEDIANLPYAADLSLACIGNYSAIVSADIPEIRDALDGDMDHIVDRILDDTGTWRTAIWRRHCVAPHFIELEDGFYLAPYWTQR